MSYSDRIRWDVAPVPGSLLWSITRDTKEVAKMFFKRRAVQSARAGCRYELECWNLRSELLVRNRKGLFTPEGSTFGDDPREVKG